MKVIDLLNKIANGEIEYEQKIKIDNEIITISHLLGAYIFSKERFNDEVEIIEENPRIKDKKIEPLTTWYGVEQVRFEQPNTFKDNAKYIDYNTEMFFNKINEIIDYLEKVE